MLNILLILLEQILSRHCKNSIVQRTPSRAKYVFNRVAFYENITTFLNLLDKTGNRRFEKTALKSFRTMNESFYLMNKTADPIPPYAKILLIP